MKRKLVTLVESDFSRLKGDDIHICKIGGEGIVNPILSIYWSKAHDGMIEAQKVEVVNTDPLGEKQSSEQIAQKYAGILPEDT